MWWVKPASGHISAAGQLGTQRALAPRGGKIKLPSLDARLSLGVGGLEVLGRESGGPEASAPSCPAGSSVGLVYRNL